MCFPKVQTQGQYPLTHPQRIQTRGTRETTDNDLYTGQSKNMWTLKDPLGDHYPQGQAGFDDSSRCVTLFGIGLEMSCHLYWLWIFPL